MAAANIRAYVGVEGMSYRLGVSSRIRACALMTILAVSVTALPATPVFAAPPADTDGAKDLYAQGKSQYDIGEYEKALALWKEAYTMLDDSPEMQTVRHTLVYNILEAEIRVYEVTKDVTHLRRAKSLLQTYLRKHREIYENTPEAEEERQTTERRLAEVEQMLADAEAQAAAAPPMDGAIPEEPKAPALNIRQAKQDRLMEIRQTPELMKLDKRYKGMIVGGSVGAGLGLILIIASPVVAVQNVTEEFDGGGGGVDGSAAGVFWTGLLFTAVGVGILIPGAVKRKRLRRPNLGSRITPYAGFGNYGLSATLNF